MKIRRQQITSLVFASIFSLALAGCQSSPTQEDTGRVVGAVIGGLLGSNVGSGSGKTIAIITGALVGGYFGGKFGKTMDDNDRYRANEAFEHNQTDQASSWRNPDNGNEYTVTPTRTYTSNDSPCRDYTTEVIIDGKSETATGTACRENGQWRVVN